MAVEVNTQLDCLELSTYNLHAPRLPFFGFVYIPTALILSPLDKTT